MAGASVAVAEAQRLIAMSLGKIAASRTQRGGINLHRNLLVAGVLHKAKTAYMMENYHHIMAARKQQQAAQAQQQEAQQLQMMSAQVNPSPCPTPGPSTAVSRVAPLSPSHAAACLPGPAPAQTAQSPACLESGSESGSASQRLAASCSVESAAAASAVEDVSMQDKENTPPPSSFAPTAAAASSACKEEDASPKAVSQLSERLSPMENQDYANGGSASCGRCVLKRRSSGGEGDCESSSPKKARLGESQDSSCENLSWGSPAPSPLSPAVEAMQVDPPQINNLVNIFNAGLSGLCSSQASDSSDSSSSSHSLLAGFGSRSQRVMDATSLLCGSQAMDSRMDSGPQAIALTV